MGGNHAGTHMKEINDRETRVKPRQRLQFWFHNISIEFGFVIIGGLGILILGILGYLPGPISYFPYITDIYLDVRSELVGIGLTVIIIDIVRIILQTREEKNKLILQMGSSDNALARDAVRQLRNKGWLEDGSLRNVDLIKADLEDADLSGADLIGAKLHNTNLINAKLIDANLSGAWLWLTRMQGANLEGAILNGATILSVNFEGAIVTNGQLAKTDILDGTKSPDGVTYGHGTIMPDGTVMNLEVFKDSIEEKESPE